jgi:hypothetical protein
MIVQRHVMVGMELAHLHWGYAHASANPMSIWFADKTAEIVPLKCQLIMALQ